MIEANREILEQRLFELREKVTSSLHVVRSSNRVIDEMPEGNELTAQQKTALMDRVGQSASDLSAAYNEAVDVFTATEALQV
jgi:hypothetical protein